MCCWAIRREPFFTGIQSLFRTLWVSVLRSGLLGCHVLPTAGINGILLWMSEGPLYLKSGPGFLGATTVSWCLTVFTFVLGS